MRTLAICIMWVACIAVLTPARAQDDSQPSTISLFGSAPIGLATQATRTHLFGLVDLYSVAVYANVPLAPAQLLSPDAAKALRIEVRYVDDLRRQVTIDWRRELVPALEPSAVAHLHGTFASLRYGDVVLIGYAPGKGTSVRVNETVVVSGANHELMLAFLDHWMGQRPVSEEIKGRLLGLP